MTPENKIGIGGDENGNNSTEEEGQEEPDYERAKILEKIRDRMQRALDFLEKRLEQQEDDPSEGGFKKKPPEA